MALALSLFASTPIATALFAFAFALNPIPTAFTLLSAFQPTATPPRSLAIALEPIATADSPLAYRILIVPHQK